MYREKDEWNFTLMIFVYTCKKNWINKVCGRLDFCRWYFFLCIRVFMCIVHYTFTRVNWTSQWTSAKTEVGEENHWIGTWNKTNSTHLQTHKNTPESKHLFQYVQTRTKVRNTTQKIFETKMWAIVLFLFHVAWSPAKRKQMSVYLSSTIFSKSYICLIRSIFAWYKKKLFLHGTWF